MKTMHLLLETLEKSAAWLSAKGLEKPRLEAEILFAHVLGCRRLDLYLRFEEPLAEGVLGRLRELLRRRAQREPWQYLIGQVDFHGLTLLCDRRALIPRPETEELVEILLSMAGQNLPENIADLGTGGGCLALALAKALPSLTVTALDRSAEALALAAENAERLGLAGRVRFVQADWRPGLPGVFDWIVSNPPYVSPGDWEQCAPEVKDYEPRQALVAEEDGLADLRWMVRMAGPALRPGGLLALECGTGQPTQLAALAPNNGWAWCETRSDLARHERFFFARWPGA